MQHIPQIHILNFNPEYLITPHSHVATIMLPCCRRAALLPPSPPLWCCCCHHAATLMPPHCRHRYAVVATALPPPRCRLHRRVTPKLPPLPLTPCRRHRRRHCQAATVTTKLLPLPLSTLQDMFDNEKEFCKMTDVDFFRLSWLFRPGIKFLHGGMHPIFDALVYLSLYRKNL